MKTLTNTRPVKIKQRVLLDTVGCPFSMVGTEDCSKTDYASHGVRHTTIKFNSLDNVFGVGFGVTVRVRKGP